MIDVDYLKKTFLDKLSATSSLDQAFTKAVWVAYKQGLEDGKKEEAVTIPSTIASTIEPPSATSE